MRYAARDRTNCGLLVCRSLNDTVDQTHEINKINDGVVDGDDYCHHDSNAAHDAG
jgi:hypothetical protein